MSRWSFVLVLTLAASCECLNSGGAAVSAFRPQQTSPSCSSLRGEQENLSVGRPCAERKHPFKSHRMQESAGAAPLQFKRNPLVGVLGYLQLLPAGTGRIVLNSQEYLPEAAAQRAGEPLSGTAVAQELRKSITALYGEFVTVDGECTLLRAHRQGHEGTHVIMHRVAGVGRSLTNFARMSFVDCSA